MLREHDNPLWLDRYSHRIEESRLPKGQTERQQYAERIDSDFIPSVKKHSCIDQGVSLIVCPLTLEHFSPVF